MKQLHPFLFCLLSFSSITSSAYAQGTQSVEGFDSVVFHNDDYYPKTRTPKDFRGNSNGYLTAGWWVPGHANKNYLSWQTAVVPEVKTTTFSFIAASAVLPSNISRGPLVKLFVNGNYALTFTIGMKKTFTWQEGEYKLRYVSKRVEYPYSGTHRQFDLNGNSGIYELTVPANTVTAGKGVEIKVELQQFERWHNGWFLLKPYKDVLKQSMESLQDEINVLRQDITSLNQQTQVLATQVYSDLLGNNKYEHRTIYTNGYRHLHPADIIRLNNNDMLIMTREGTEHISNDGEVIMLRSSDNGKTWGKKQNIASIKDLDEREGCGIQLRDGTIVVGIFYNGLYDTDGKYGTNHDVLIGEKKSASEGPGKHYLGAYTITSTDNGYTWSQPNYIDTRNMPFTNLEGPTDAPIQMPDGSILMAVIGYSPQKDAKNRSSVMLRSIDKGRTWTYYSTIASDPGGKLGGFMEPGIVRTNTGRIVVGLRNHAPEQNIWSTYSDDNGKTWAPVWKTDLIGHPADIIQLKDGRLLMTYGVRPGSHDEPGGVRGCFSTDNGKTWDVNSEVQLRNDFLNWDIGYPESLQLADGTVLTVYYFNLFGKYFIGSTTWKP